MGVLVSTGGQAVGGIQPGEANVIAYNGGWASSSRVSPRIRSAATASSRTDSAEWALRRAGHGDRSPFLRGARGPDAERSRATPIPGANERQNHPIITSAVPGRRRNACHRHAQQPGFDDLRSRLLLESRLPRPAARSSPGRVLSRLGPRSRRTHPATPSFNLAARHADPSRARPSPRRDRPQRKHVGAFAGDRVLGGPGRRRTGRHGQPDHRRPALRPGGDRHGRRQSGAADVYVRRRLCSFVGPSLTPGGVYDVTVTNPGGLSGTIKNGYVVALPGRPEEQPVRRVHLQARRRRPSRPESARATSARARTSPASRWRSSC